MTSDADRLAIPPLQASAGRPGLREAVLARLLGRLDSGQLTVVTPEGRRIAGRGPRPGPEAVLVINRWRALGRLVLGGDVGFSSAYLAGDWSSPDLPSLIEFGALNRTVLPAASGALAPFRLWHRAKHALRRNSRSGSRRNIAFHYDLGNDFYRHWLDAGMNYSSAIAIAPGESLEAAQAGRLERIADMLDVRPGCSVLEIGCGWGALAAALAGRGANVTGITLSREQLAYAQERLASQPELAARADLRLQDYRDVTGRFDRIVSIEMVEAVGEAYWPAYFTKLRECLTPGGTAVLQVITIAENRFEAYRRNTDFIQRHIFPGGMLPTRSHVETHARAAGLEPVERLDFGHGYAQTLAEWRRRFGAARDALAPMGFGPDFNRLWDYYLSYCEGGFRAGTIDVSLFRLQG